MGDGDDRTFRSSEGERLGVVCLTAMSAGGEADAFNVGEGLVVVGRIVLEGSMTGLSEMVGMRRPSVVI